MFPLFISRHSKLLIALFYSFFILTGCSTNPTVIEYSDEFKGNGQHKIYVISHGWHTGFVIPASNIQNHIPELKSRFGVLPYIEFGWGDKGFYQANEITTGLTLQAIFWPTESVIHSVAVPFDVNTYFADSQIKTLCLDDAELSSLVRFISASFYKDKNNKVQTLKRGIYGDSQFYKGVGDYYLFNTCNNWTAKGLKSIGMDISTTFKLTSGSVMGYLESLSQNSCSVQ